MEPTRPVEANFTYHAPPGQEDEVGSLEVRRDVQAWTVASAWEPSDEERSLLAAGAHIELCVWTIPPPPVSVLVRGPACDECGREAVWDGKLEAFTCTHVEGDRDPGLGVAPEAPPPASGAGDGTPGAGDPEGG